MLDVVILAVTQGLTEFLPISSSGHLVLVRVLFGISDDAGQSLDAWLHIGTLLAVVVYYWRTWLRLSREMILVLFISTVPAAGVGYFFADYVSSMFRSGLAVAIGLLFTALILYVSDRKTPLPNAGEVGRRDGLLIGLFQVLALVPGVSRSGMTMGAGRMLGFSREKAAEFSFLLSGPIIAGAALVGSIDLFASQTHTFSDLFVGLIVSFFSGLLAIHLVLRLVQRMSFTPFVLYVIVVALGLLVYG